MSTTNLSNTDQLATGVSVVCCTTAVCGPCKIFKPIFAEVSKQFANKVNFCFLNLDTTDLAIAHQVRSVPTLLLVEGGEVVSTSSAPQSASQLTSLVQGWLHAMDTSAA